jgi:hypothetical protein
MFHIVTKLLIVSPPFPKKHFVWNLMEPITTSQQPYLSLDQQQWAVESRLYESQRGFVSYILSPRMMCRIYVYKQVH